jgi:3-dehydroquinate synthase
METVNILNKYQVYIGSKIIADLSNFLSLDSYSKIIVIADEKVPNTFLKSYPKILISSGEINKNIDTVQIIWQRLLDLGADRKTLVINLGGGVIGDMGGFAASTYMRGIEFLQIPTTLLSAVDASVGGKVGIDFQGVKNLIGSFNQPIGVVIDVETFQSLPEREFISGFGEIIKHGIIADEPYFKLVTSKKPQDFSDLELIEIIKRSCQIKAQIISSDEKELGSRKLLNFAHTIGHALESASLTTGSPLLHGEAVSIGMIAEAKLAQELGLINENVLEEIKKALVSAGLPVKTSLTDIDLLISLISKDKKSDGGKINWTLIKGIGEAVINQTVDEQKVRTALAFIQD